MPTNTESSHIFFIVRYQLITGMGGPVDINHEAIHQAMKLYQIRDKKACFEKILHLAWWWIGQLKSKAES